MNADQLVPVVYLGHKDRKEDNVARSGVVWHGHGDVQNVTAQQWGLLSAHPSVWAKSTQVAQAAAASIALGKTEPTPVVVHEPPKTAPVAADPNVVKPTAQDSDPNVKVQALLGSDLLPAHIQIGDELVQLGTVVAKAHEASGLTVEDWNGLVPQIREKLLADYVENLRTPADANTQAGNSQGDPNGQPEATQEQAASDLSAAKDPSAEATQPVRRRRGAAATGEVS